MENNTNKKLIVVTGAAGYLGLEVVKQLLENGFRVAMLVRNSSKARAGEILPQHSELDAFIYECDLDATEQVEKVFADIELKQGQVYGVVHAAGIKPERKQLSMTSAKDMDAQYVGTLRPAYNVLTLGAKVLKAHKEGVLIGVTTVGVVQAEATRSLGAYIPAKYAVQGMLVALKEELKDSGIYVCSVAPGFMPGGMNGDIPAAFVQMIQAKSPTHTLASAQTVATRITEVCLGKVRSESLTIPVAPEYGLN